MNYYSLFNIHHSLFIPYVLLRSHGADLAVGASPSPTNYAAYFARIWRAREPSPLEKVAFAKPKAEQMTDEESKVLDLFAHSINKIAGAPFIFTANTYSQRYLLISRIVRQLLQRRSQPATVYFARIWRRPRGKPPYGVTLLRYIRRKRTRKRLYRFQPLRGALRRRISLCLQSVRAGRACRARRREP